MERREPDENPMEEPNPAAAGRRRTWGALVTGTLAALSILGVSSACIGWLYVEGQRAQEQSSFAMLRQAAVVAASQIDPAAHAALTRDEQTRSLEYKAAIAPLLRLHGSLPDIQHLYTLVENEGKLFFVLDTATYPEQLPTQRALKSSRVMELCKDSFGGGARDVVQVLQAGRVYVTPRPYTEQFGTFFSALAPFFDASGRLAGAVGADQSIEDFYRGTVRLRAAAHMALTVAALVAVLVGVVVLRYRTRAMEQEWRRVQAEEALRNSQEQFEAIYQESPVGIALATVPDLKILSANRAFCNLLGYTEDELKTKHIADLSIPEELEVEHRLGRRVTDGKERRFSYEKRYITRSNQTIWVNLSGSVIHNRNGRPLFGIGVVVNISDRKRVEEQLRESEARFRELVEYLREAFWMRDASTGRMLYLSPAFEQIWQRSTREASESPERWYDFIHSGDRQRVRDAYEKHRLTGEYSEEFRIVRPDGNIRWISERAITVRNRDGDVYRIAGIAEDVTDRKNAERAAAEVRAQLKATIESMPFEMFALSREGHCIMQNSVSRQHWGDSLGRTISEMPVDQATRERWSKAVEVVLRGERVDQESEYEVRGRRLMMRYILAPIRDGDAIRGIVGIGMDVTEQRSAADERQRLEAQVRQAQKLESLGVLAGGIAHDFNNLLMAVLGNVDLALPEVAPASPVRSNLLEIEKTARRASELCRQLLAYSGKGQVVVEPVNVNHVVTEMSEILGVSVSKKASLVYDLAKSLPPVMADITQIRQVAINLIVNASEALGSQPGTITIRSGTMHWRPALATAVVVGEKLTEGDYVFVEVCDTGCGMNDGMLERVFDPFFTTKFAGRGLGLAAVLGIVRAHKGAVQVFSRPGAGSTFRVLLPPASTQALVHSMAAPVADAGWRGEGLILLADDEESVRSVTARMLERAGFRVVAASDGAEALACFRRQASDFRAVVLDFTMPGLDGAEVLAEIRRTNATVPVLMSSGYGGAQMQERFRDLGASGFVEKPFRAATLLAALRGALES